MSNPIRIAQGPPTEAGNYLLRDLDRDSNWRAVVVVKTSRGTLILIAGDTQVAVSKTKGASFQWSTRIPDPEEE